MKPLLDVLVILDALDKEGSFAAASAKLYKTPSALSYTIHKLESDLNIQLLDRSGPVSYTHLTLPTKRIV